MAAIHLSIVTPESEFFAGEADRVMVRTIGGDVAILPGHIDYAASLGSGTAKITVNGSSRAAEISGGVIVVNRNIVRILTNSFAWKE